MEADLIVAVIPAKGSSRRLPNKNMLDLIGKPLINYTVDYALCSNLIEAVYVSTDSDEISLHAKSMGVQVIRRDESLGGETPIIDVYRHAYKQIGDPSITYIFGLQPDHPDRSRNPDEIIQYFLEQEADQLFSKDDSGTKNGAHYIVSSRVLEGKRSSKDVIVFDRCTNVHYESDLKEAEKNIIQRQI